MRTQYLDKVPPRYSVYCVSQSSTRYPRRVSSATLHRHRRTASPSSSYYEDEEYTVSRMRYFLSFGLLIPAIAAITGVVTWSVSAQAIHASKDHSQMHLIPSTAAFRFSQGARDHEWHSLLNNDQLDTSQSDSKEDYDLTLDSMTPDPVSTYSPLNVSVNSLYSFNSTSSSLPQVTTSSGNIIANSTLLVTTTISPMTSTSMKTLLMPANSTLPSHELVNNSTINNSISNAVTDVKIIISKKKSPGEHVAAVIDKLISTRKYEGSKPKILVVAPASGTSRKSIDTMIANVYSTDSTSSKKSKSIKEKQVKLTANKSSTLTVTPGAATDNYKSTTLPSDTHLTVHQPTLGHIRRSNQSTTFVSKDADTLMAAAQLLSARHKVISARFDHQQNNRTSVISTTTTHRDIYTTVKPPTTPFSRINHMQFPPPRAVSTPSHKSQQQQQQLTHTLHRHEHPLNSASSVKLHHRSLEKQQVKVPVHGKQVAMASAPMVTRILPERRVIIHQNQQQQQQVSHILPQQQVPIFTGHQQIALETASPYHIHQQQQPHQHNHQHHHHQMQLQLQQLPSSPERQYSPVTFQQSFPQAVQQLHVAPARPILAQPMAQMPLYQGQMYQEASSPPLIQQNNAPVNGNANHATAEPVDESQLISHSAHTINSGEESKNNAMISMHASDQQSGESSKGLTLHFGGGPGAAGSQLITSPMGIFKSLFLPLLPKPRMRLNGKVVFGVVLDSQITPKKG